ncbi:MAG: hypothetical protein K0S28_656 [Paucimonas sp.]|nr:hypothetical protein [Paucimonas sp.]
MKLRSIILLSLMATGCASTIPVSQETDSLFHDSAFSAASTPIDKEKVFAISPQMQDFIRTIILPNTHKKGSALAIYDALYMNNQLKLNYDSEKTRTAAEAFETQSGNCLSLAIMTAAIAKEMGLRVEFKEVEVADTWNRIGQTYFSIGHVNVTINEKPLRSARDISRPVTIDFIPTDELKQRQAERISEETVAAMYMNNRAAEMLAEGKLDEAYGWARAAIRQDRKFLGAYNTLGVIYKAHGNLAEAEKVLRRVMAAKPDNAIAMSNLAQVLTSAGRHEESKLLAERVERLQPYPPYHFFNLGMAAVNSGDYKKARSLFKKEVDRSPNTHEFHYWYAIASAQTGEMETAKRHMALAVESSSTLKERKVYATKLNQLISMQRTQIKDIVLQ